MTTGSSADLAGALQKASPADWARTGAGRLRDGWFGVVESAVAATLAWIIATRLVGHSEPFFAPVATIVVLQQARGQRIRRTVEVLLGVAGGVLLADLVAKALGTRTTWTIFVIVLLTLLVTTAFDASVVLVVQASVSGLYVAVFSPPTGSLVPLRFIDALIGGLVAIVTSQLVVARDPVAPLVQETREMFDELSDVTTDVAQALDANDEAAARAALERARAADAALERLRTAVEAAGEALRTHTRRRQALGGVRAIADAIGEVDKAVRNVRVLARAGVTMTRLQPESPPDVGAALHSLSGAIRAVGDELASDLVDSHDVAAEHRRRAEHAALEAVRLAAPLLETPQPFALVMIVGQVRATAIDLLRGAGGDETETLRRVDEALGLPPV